jgi:hypothetical protein
MEANKDFWELQREIIFEWSRYVLSHPDILDDVPNNARIVFMLDDNPAFTSWSLKMNEAKRESDQPIIYVRVKKFLPSRLVEPHLEAAG